MGWMMRLEGKICLITGGAGGIGAAMARRMAQEGATAIIADRDFAGAERVANDIPRAEALELDVADAAAFAALAADIADRHGRIDVLCNNAGIGAAARLEDITPELFDRSMRINAFSIIAGTQAVAPIMRSSGGGSIINTCSTAGKRAFPGHVLYAATKFAVRALTIGFAQELAPDKIRVNAISPGMVHTPLWRDMTENGLSGAELVDAYAQATALGRAATPDDLTGTVIYLASSDSDYVTGKLIDVDGGIIFE